MLLLASATVLTLSRAPPPMMGGLTGLPRIPPEALKLTRSLPNRGEYTEPVATLWRDLETLYGEEDIAGLGGSRTTMDRSRYVDSGVSTNKFRGFTYNVDMRVATVMQAVRKEPSLLNPDVSNRFVFATSKAILVQKLGSQPAALALMKQNPAVLQMGDALEDCSPMQIRSSALTKTLTSGPFSALVLATAGAAYAYSEGLLPDGLR